MARKRAPGGHGGFGHQTRRVERLAHRVHQGLDVGVGDALIDANEGNAEPPAARRQNLPVSQVKSADDEGLRAARRVVETLRRLEDDAVALHQRFDAKALGESSPKVFPHRRSDRGTLARRLFRVGESKIRERALLSVEARGDEAPQLSRDP